MPAIYELYKDFRIDEEFLRIVQKKNKSLKAEGGLEEITMAKAARLEIILRTDAFNITITGTYRPRHVIMHTFGPNYSDEKITTPFAYPCYDRLRGTAEYR